MRKLHLSPEQLRIESFEPAPDPGPSRGTAHANALSIRCPTRYEDSPSCQYGSCEATDCGSCGDPTCEWTCGPPNYGCDSVDPRCTYGGVYPC